MVLLIGERGFGVMRGFDCMRWCMEGVFGVQCAMLIFVVELEVLIVFEECVFWCVEVCFLLCCVTMREL